MKVLPISSIILSKINSFINVKTVLYLSTQFKTAVYNEITSLKHKSDKNARQRLARSSPRAQYVDGGSCRPVSFNFSAKKASIRKSVCRTQCKSVNTHLTSKFCANVKLMILE